jgi:hypothetical protein
MPNPVAVAAPKLVTDEVLVLVVVALACLCPDCPF